MTDTIAPHHRGSRVVLGRAMALHLAPQGYRCHFHLQLKQDGSRRRRRIEALGRKAVALQLDTSDTSGFADFAGQLSAALKQGWGRERFDFLVNNAGIGIHKSFAETTEAEFDQLVNIHLKGVFFLTQRLLGLIEDGGRIVNLSSGLARFALPGYAAYGSMKGAVEVLTRYLARELGPRGIAVNTIAPGAIETDFGGGAVRDNPDLNRMIASQTAMGRVGLPDDIGGAVASLLTGDNGWVTGQRIEVSGGQGL
ncbi:MAG: SDR family oxidoreductase [Brucellaceae bacterium]|nr:SDR family oxidoreductase [Brucellaceae bacterium]